jgi:hypothetical protein
MFKELTEEWEIERRRAISSEAFRSTNKVQFELGSILLLQTPASYDAKKVFKY